MTFNEFAKYEKFFGKDWVPLLRPILSSNEYKRIGTEILKQKKAGIEITPGFDNMFRAYKECPVHKLHSVIIGQDVYPGRNKDGTMIADGIAFSAMENSDTPPSLNSILEAIDTDVYKDDDQWCPTAVYNHARMEATWDLKPWANDGILLINCAYSTVVGRPNDHIPIWKPFTEFVVKMLNEKKDSLGFILIGSHAKSHRALITNPTHGVFQCEHPAAAMYKKRKWEHNNVFSSLTDFQKKTNNIKIKW